MHVVLGSCLVFIALLLLFRVGFTVRGDVAAVGFYILVDIFSVVLVEQFWSLTNTISSRDEGLKSYWFVGTGGLVGGVAGGATAALLISHTPLTTPDLLLSCAACLLVIIGLNLWMARAGLYRELPRPESAVLVSGRGLASLLESRYLLLIAGTLLFAQLAQPIVEFQFLNQVSEAYPERESRTAFISWFFSLLGLVSIGVNVVLTPIVHRWMGMLAGLFTQPVLLSLFSFGFMAQPVLWMAGAMKIADRGLSYSINRASKELLYIPVDPVKTYQAKAWIDMLGYRLFKVLGSVLILAFAEVLSIGQMSWLTFAVCLCWMGVLAMIAREHARVSAAPLPA
ncbi:MAG: ATP translocase [Gammaproteobacteria bacterium]|nr:ATP translocase [Gammaproteobacteria bacterium]